MSCTPSSQTLLIILEAGEIKFADKRWEGEGTTHKAFPTTRTVPIVSGGDAIVQCSMGLLRLRRGMEVGQGTGGCVNPYILKYEMRSCRCGEFIDGLPGRLPGRQCSNTEIIFEYIRVDRLMNSRRGARRWPHRQGQPTKTPDDGQLTAVLLSEDRG